MLCKVLRYFFLSVLTAGLFIACTKPQRIVRYGDMLPRSSPEKQGVASEGILRFLEEVENRQLELHSFMMLRHGKVISECWWHPYKADINHAMYSVSKTFTSTAIGFAVKEKRLKVTDKVISFFPDDLPATISPYLEELTIKDLLTMTVGHEEAPVFTMNDENWVRSFLAAPIVHEPGTRFQYSSYASYMLSAIINKVTGENTYDYLKTRLFDPLGITDIQWETGADGISAGGWGLRMKTVDMAKLGQLYLKKGVWEGERLLPASWIEDASSPHIYQFPERTPQENSNDEGAQGYGYQIWMCTHNAYRADGAYGQFIIVIPERDAVIVTTARGDNMHQILDMVWEYIYPVMLDRMLKTDEASWDDMNARKASLHIKNPFLTPDGLQLLTDTTLTYQMEPNEQHIQTINFRFDAEAQCQMTLSTNDAVYPLLFGEDNWMYGETDRPGPYFRDPRRNAAGLAPYTVAGYGSWEKEGVMQLRLYYLTDIQYETFSCYFQKDQLIMECTNSMYPKAPPIQMKGKPI